MSDSNTLATFAGGCFWCTEAVFREVRGVSEVLSGYIGGDANRTTYREVCSGQTGHAEAVQIRFDPNQVEYAKLLEIFFRTHDPTTLNRQGADTGTQYRSAVFFHNEEQEATAKQVIADLESAGAFNNPIVTEVTPASEFFTAEADHQNYFARSGGNPYCAAVIVPKLEKFRKVFADQLN